MGYCIHQLNSKFTIKRNNFDKALEALKSTFIPENMDCADYIGGKEYPHFSWVDTQIVLNATTLEAALEEIRYCAQYDSNGDIINIKFTGEKYGADKIFFEALACYVEKDSFIAFEGADGYSWEWRFDGEQVVENYIRGHHG